MNWSMGLPRRSIAELCILFTPEFNILSSILVGGVYIGRGREPCSTARVGPLLSVHDAGA